MDNDRQRSGAEPVTETATGQVPGPLRAAVVLIGLESLALLGAGVFAIVSTLVGDPTDLGLALLAALFAIGTAAGLGFGARQLLRLQSAARSPIVVVQLLALPVAYSLGFQAGRIGYGAPILVCALAVLFLLFTPPVRDALDREPPR